MALWRFKEPSSTIQVTLIALGIATGAIILVVVLLMTFKYAPWRHQQPLILTLNSFAVTNFNTSDHNSVSPAAVFHTKLLFANRNTQLDISIPAFQSLLHFQPNNSNINNRTSDSFLGPISCAVVEAVHLGPTRRRMVDVAYGGDDTCGGEQPFVEESVLEEMRREIEGKGVLGIDVGLDFRVKYRTGILFWDYELKPKCPTVRVRFDVASGVGWLDSHSPLNCSSNLN